MAEEVKYDPEIMKELVQTCKAANEETQKAQNLLEEIRSHQDWTCREKDKIDDDMSEIKKMINQTSENSSSYLQAVENVEGRLQYSEREIIRLFESVEETLRKILAISVGTVTTSGSELVNNIVNTVKSVTESITGDNETETNWLESTLKEIVSVSESISVIDFQQLSTAMDAVS